MLTTTGVKLEISKYKINLAQVYSTLTFNKINRTRFWNSSVRRLIFITVTSGATKDTTIIILKWKNFFSLFFRFFANSLKQKSTKEFFFSSSTTLYEDPDHLIIIIQLYAESRTEILSPKEFDAKAKWEKKEEYKHLHCWWSWET